MSCFSWYIKHRDHGRGIGTLELIDKQYLILWLHHNRNWFYLWVPWTRLSQLSDVNNNIDDNRWRANKELVEYWRKCVVHYQSRKMFPHEFPFQEYLYIIRILQRIECAYSICFIRAKVINSGYQSMRNIVEKERQ